MTSPPTPPLQGERRRILNIKYLSSLKVLITPPSLEGKGVGGLGHRGLWERMKQPWIANIITALENFSLIKKEC
uniref:Uncharacterized protein n=1 Tax=Planktothrix pseudagardhii TaxID=132604 RepID=A0A9W4CJF9_9CYAN|nr:hypothetical protein NO713_02015 [Planktothrix pseudagardhii]